MTKKLISLMLSLSMVIGLVPVMSVSASAEVAVQVMYDDYESYEVGQTFNTDFNKNTEDGKIGPISLGISTGAEIVSMVGYDGTITKALKVFTDPDAEWTTTTGAGRINYSRKDMPESGMYVTEFKIYVPEDVMVDGEPVSRTFSRLHGNPFIFDGDRFGAGNGFASNQYDDVSEAFNKGEWYKLTYVQDLTNGKVSLFINDKLTNLYKFTDTASDFTKTSGRIQIYSRGSSPTKEILADKHLIFDDFNFYVPTTTTVSSTYANGNNVLVTANPTVDFSAVVLDREKDDIDTVSASNVTVTKNDGTEVSIEDVTVGNNGKSIVIDPVAAFEPGATYNVTVSGLTDIYEQTIDTFEFSFTTADVVSVELVSAPKFAKANLFSNTQGTELTALENGYVNVNYGIKNTSATKTYSAVLLTVLRDGGDVKYFQFETGTVAPGGELTFDGSFMVDDAENQSIETYVWDSLSGVAALTEKYIINADGITNVAIENQ